MSGKVWMGLLICVTVVGVGTCAAQGGSQVQLKIEPANRTLTISAEGRVSVEPEIAILHIGFETGVDNAKNAYADGARTSNAIVAALKQVGVEEKAIRSESQSLAHDYSNKQHKFKLTQQWTVKVPPMKVAEALDAAVNAGANDSGQIEWTVNDPQALETQALAQASASARQQAEELAKAMGVKLGKLVYVSNQMAATLRLRTAQMMDFNQGVARKASPQLSVEPNKVERDATVYAVYSIE